MARVKAGWIAFIVLALLLGLSSPAAASRAAADLPDEAYVSGFVGHGQGYNLSCESRSSADWANFFGVNASEDDILWSLPITDNPETGFVGDVNGQWGAIPPYAYGVHPPPLVKVLRDLGLPADGRSGLSWDEARAEIAANRPVIVWVIGAMWAGTPIDYTDSEGQTTVVAHFEHSMVLTGYSATSVQVVDAYSGATQYYSLASFLASWGVLGNRAIVANPQDEPPTPTPVIDTPTPTPLPTPPDRVVVKSGDSLLGLADRYKVHWQVLVALNHLNFPYFLYPSQVLVLPTPLPGAPTPVIPTATPAPTQTPAPTATLSPPPQDETPDSYVVQKGDYLSEVGRRFGVNWLTLAELNNIPYPYVIYPGQVLKLR